MSSLAEWNERHSDVPPPKSVLGRIITIFDVIKESGGCASITDIAVRSRLPKSTVSRLVSELTAQRYLTRTDEGVSLGLRLFELGARANLPRRLIGAAAPVIRHLFDNTGERIVLWIQQGDDMVSLAAVRGRLPMLPTTAGMRSPVLTTASGKAFLAFCADQRIVKRISAPLVDRAATEFHDELSRVRASVVAIDFELSYSGIAAVASPILSPDQVVLGAISLAGPSDGIDPDGVAPLIRAASTNVTRRLAAA